MAYAGLAVMRAVMHRTMRRPVRPVMRSGAGAVMTRAGAVRPVVRPGRTVRPVAGAMPAMRLMPGTAMRLVGRTVRRPVVVGAAMRRTGFRFFHEDDGRSGGSHAHERGEAEKEGTTADLLRLGRGVHKASPKC